MDEFFDSTFSSNSSIIQFVLYVLTLLYTFLASAFCFIFLMRKTNNIEERDLVRDTEVVEHADIVIAADKVEKN